MELYPVTLFSEFANYSPLWQIINILVTTVVSIVTNSSGAVTATVTNLVNNLITNAHSPSVYYQR